jgi:flavorubredoxin
MWGATGLQAKLIEKALLSKNIEVKMFNLGQSGLGEISPELVDSSGLILLTPTILGQMHPQCSNFMNIVKILKSPIKYGGIVNSYGWVKSATKHAVAALEDAKIEIVDKIEINGPPLDDDIIAINNMCEAIAEKINEG